MQKEKNKTKTPKSKMEALTAHSGHSGEFVIGSIRIFISGLGIEPRASHTLSSATEPHSQPLHWPRKGNVSVGVVGGRRPHKLLQAGNRRQHIAGTVSQRAGQVARCAGEELGGRMTKGHGAREEGTDCEGRIPWKCPTEEFVLCPEGRWAAQEAG